LVNISTFELSFAAATAWLAPFPPQPILNAGASRVSLFRHLVGVGDEIHHVGANNRDIHFTTSQKQSHNNDIIVTLSCYFSTICDHDRDCSIITCLFIIQKNVGNREGRKIKIKKHNITN
jgi:hypothetical protein